MTILSRKAIIVCACIVVSGLNSSLVAAQVGVSLTGFEGVAGESIEVAVELTNVEATTGFSSFSFTIILDTPGVVYLGHDKTGTLSATPGWAVNSSTTTNKVGGFASSLNAIDHSGTLIILRFRLDSVASGVTNSLDQFTLRLSSDLVTHLPAVPSASIAAQNGLPSAAPATVETDEEDPIDIVLEGSDPENDPITFSIFRNPDNGDVDLTGSNALYTPDTDFSGTDSFEFVTNDGQGDSAPATVTIIVHPVNDPPGSPSILAPVDGATVTVEGNPADTIVISWENAVDPDDDPLEYTWQLSETDTFADLLLSVDVGSEVELGLTISELAVLLSSKGITVGQSLSAHHRVVVTDGIETVQGSSSNITFERGLITETEINETIPIHLSIDSIFPNPAATSITIRYSLPTSSAATLLLFDVLGREVHRGIIPPPQSGFYDAVLDIRYLSVGIYHVQLKQDGLSHVRSLIVRR